MRSKVIEIGNLLNKKTILFIDINPVIVLLQGPSGGQETKDYFQ